MTTREEFRLKTAAVYEAAAEEAEAVFEQAAGPAIAIFEQEMLRLAKIRDEILNREFSAYRAAVVAPEAIYEEVVKNARAIYEKAVAGPRTAYQAIERSAREPMEARVAEAWNGYHQERQHAEAIFEKAAGPAREQLKKALEECGGDYDRVMQEIRARRYDEEAP